MKKIVISLAVIILLTFVFIPWATGYYFKSHYLALVDRFNQSDSDFRIDIMDYELGYRHSEIKARLISKENRFTLIAKLAAGALPNVPLIVLPFEQTVTHGPIVSDPIQNKMTTAAASVQSYIDFSGIIKQFLASKTSQKIQLDIKSIAHFNGDYINKINLPPFRLTELDFNNLKSGGVVIQLSTPNLSELAWNGGINGAVEFKATGNTVNDIKYAMQLGPLSLTSDRLTKRLQLTLSPIFIKGNKILDPTNTWKGTDETKLANTLLKYSQSTLLFMQDLMLSNETNVSQHTVNMILKLSFKKLLLPEFEMNDLGPANMAISINNLNAKPFATSRYSAEPWLLINNKTSVENNVMVNTALGKIEAHGKMSWPSVTEKTPMTADGIETRLQAKLDLKINRVLATELVKMMLPYMSARSANTYADFPVSESTKAPSPARERFTHMITQLIQQGELDLPRAIDIMNLRDKNQSQADFSTNVHLLPIAEPVKIKLIQAYSSILTEPRPTQTQVAGPTPTPAVRAETTLINWVRQGFLAKEENDYVTSITYEMSTLKINGRTPPSSIK